MNLKVYLNIVKMPNIARKINQDFCTQKNNNNKVILGNKNVCNFYLIDILYENLYVWIRKWILELLMGLDLKLILRIFSGSPNESCDLT